MVRFNKCDDNGSDKMQYDVKDGWQWDRCGAVRVCGTVCVCVNGCVYASATVCLLQFVIVSVCDCVCVCECECVCVCVCFCVHACVHVKGGYG